MASPGSSVDSCRDSCSLARRSCASSVGEMLPAYLTTKVAVEPDSRARRSSDDARTSTDLEVIVPLWTSRPRSLRSIVICSSFLPFFGMLAIDTLSHCADLPKRSPPLDLRCRLARSPPLLSGVVLRTTPSEFSEPVRDVN